MRIQPDDTEVVETLPHTGGTAQTQRMVATDYQGEGTTTQRIVNQLRQIVIHLHNGIQILHALTTGKLIGFRHRRHIQVTQVECLMSVSPDYLHQSPLAQMIRCPLHAFTITSQIEGNAYYIYFHDPICFIYLSELSQCLPNNLHCFQHLCVGNDQRRGKAYDMIVSGFGNQAIFF